MSPRTSAARLRSAVPWSAARSAPQPGPCCRAFSRTRSTTPRASAIASPAAGTNPRLPSCRRKPSNRPRTTKTPVARPALTPACAARACDLASRPHFVVALISSVVHGRSVPLMTLLALAERQLLQPGGLSSGDLDRVFSQLMGPSIDAADLYFQHSRSESWMLEDGIVKEGNHSIEQGVGVRAMSGEKTGFAYSDEIVLPQLLTAARSARAIAQSGADRNSHALAARDTRALYPPLDPVESLPTEEKITLLREVDKFCRALDPCISQVIVSVSGVLDTVMIAAADGTLAADVRPLVRLNVQVIAERNGRREQGSAGGGGRYGYRELLANGRAHALAREAVRQALVNLDSVPAPAGTMTVVLGPGWPGVLLHEAIGHGFEGDFNRKGTSAFAGRMGEKIASPLCTIVDDGTLPNRRGSLSVDDEGVPTQCTTLIE